jgi:dTDP-4-dehydrorhamnose 3,5-epimerase
LKFVSTEIDGVFLIEPEPVRDERGSFARTFCEEEFRAHGLDPHVAQAGISFNPAKGTLRGLHFQREPHGEAKLVRCSRGAIYDVVVDLRSGRWVAAELSDRNGRMLFAPSGFAHGFQTLQDDTEVVYQLSAKYRQDAASGVRWNDPALGIKWPLEVSVMSERDRSWPELQR